MQMVADRAGMSRTTLRSIEQGKPGVTIGAYANALHSLGLHEDLGLALNYWLNPGFVLKLNFHRVEGNRLAFPTQPERILELLGGTPLDDRTDLIQFGIQLGF